MEDKFQKKPRLTTIRLTENQRKKVDSLVGIVGRSLAGVISEMIDAYEVPQKKVKGIDTNKI
jgi:predicted DNA-binding protein